MSDVTKANPAEVRPIVERVERAQAEKADAAQNEKDIWAEAKANGHDIVALKKVVARRKLDRDAVAEADAMVELYENALS